MAVGKSVLEHEIQPLFQQRWTAVPIERVLEHDDVVFQKQSLFLRHVYVEVGVMLIEIAEGEGIRLLHRFDQKTVAARALVGGVGEQNQDTRFGHRLALGLVNFHCWITVRQDGFAITGRDPQPGGPTCRVYATSGLSARSKKKVTAFALSLTSLAARGP